MTSHDGSETPHVRWLHELDDGVRAQVGGKAAGLARLLALGMPVPPGFCITAGASRTGDGSVTGALRGEVEAAWERLAADGDAPVAVRSSATCEDGAEHSFAGQYVTALSAPAAPTGDGAGDAWEDRQVWTNVNTGEVAPDVTTPLSWDVVEPIATRLLGVFFDMAGVEIAGHQVLGLVGGRVYFNLNTVLGLLRRLPGMKDKGVLQLFGGEEEAPPELGDLDIPDEDIPEARHSVLGMLWHAPALLWGMLRFPRGGAQRVVARLRREADELAARPLDGADDLGLAARIGETIDHVQGDTGAFRATAFATMVPTGLYRLCGKWFGEDGNATASRLLGGLGDTETAEAGLALWRLAAQARRSPPLAELLRSGGGIDELRARLDEVEGGGEFRRSWDAFLARHGHHCRAELELSNPRWVEQPGPLLDQLRSYLDGFDQRDLEAHYQQVARRREQTEAECLSALRGPVRRLLFRLLVDAAQRTAPYRETIKSQVIRKLMVLRRQLLQAGRRLQRRGVLEAADDVFYLRLAQLDALLQGEDDDPAAVREAVAERRAERAFFQRCTPPPVLRGRYDPERHVWADPQDAGDGVLRGIAVNPGVVVGPARVILRAGDDQVRPGEILVAPFTDPGWTPYFLNAGAIVMDLGGVLSHGSIIARELGIPAVVNVDRATRRIRTGQRLEVDGTRGTVRVLDAPPATPPTGS